MEQESDFLVIGSGISGLSFAIKAAALGRVTLVTKKARPDTATNLAQGGIAAVLAGDDSFALHIEDTLRAGVGLCHEEIVRLVVESGPARIDELIGLGIRFQHDSGDPSRLDLGREGGHSTRRIAHAMDLTGARIEEGLLAHVEADPRITVLENHLAVDLLIDPDSRPTNRAEGSGGRCVGAWVLDRQRGTIDAWRAKVTVLCTGGAGKVYLYTTNPDIATGDGIAMAYRAGARVANLEFVQFHPTCLYHPQVKNFLVSEAVRGEGGRLVDRQGRTFTEKYDPRGDLATRDAVARAIDRELKASGDDCVFLDISHRPAEFVRKRFPTIYARCLSLGIDMTREPIPVVPAAHYLCGGVLTDRWGRTSLENLFALGETACTGLHGGNRLASNSLLEAVVFAHQAFLFCKEGWPRLRELPSPRLAPWTNDQVRRIEENVLISHNWDQIRRLMWNYVGIVRSLKRLRLVQEHLVAIGDEVDQLCREHILTPDLIELRNIAQLARLIVHCACGRRESRGLHYLVDFPEVDNRRWQKDNIVLPGEPLRCPDLS